MSSTLSPNGLTPSRRWGSSSNSTGTNMYNIADGYATALFTGALVEVSAGNITILANSTNSGAKPIGVFQGCQYTALNGTPTWSSYWPAATSVMTGSQAIGYVCDDPYATFMIQADGPVSAQNLMTTNYEVNIGTGGSTFTGVDNTSLKYNSGVTTASALVRPIAYEATPGNTQASAYPRLEVELIHHGLRQGSVT